MPWVLIYRSTIRNSKVLDNTSLFLLEEGNTEPVMGESQWNGETKQRWLGYHKQGDYIVLASTKLISKTLKLYLWCILFKKAYLCFEILVHRKLSWFRIIKEVSFRTHNRIDIKKVNRYYLSENI